MLSSLRRFLCAVLATAAICSCSTRSRCETLEGSDLDSRVIVAFKVNAAAVQAGLPDGWTLAPIGKGPLAGSDLLVVFVDRKLGLDPQGKPAPHALYRGVAIAATAHKDDETRLFVTRVYVTQPDENPYRNSVAAKIARTLSTWGAGNDPESASDEWVVDPEGGGEMTLKMRYKGALPHWSESESKPYSAVEPEFYRIYRYQQISTLLKSTPAKVNRLEEVSFNTTIPELAAMFDGSQQLVAVVNIPWFYRHIYMP